MESRAASGGGYSLRVFRRGVLPRLACNVLSLRCVSNHIGVRLLFVRRGDRYRLVGVGLRGAPCDAAVGEPQSGAGHGRVHGGRIGPYRVGMLRGTVPGVEGCGAACGGGGRGRSSSCGPSSTAFAPTPCGLALYHAMAIFVGEVVKWLFMGMSVPYLLFSPSCCPSCAWRACVRA